jgi:opacity protein-like surface antigen
MLRNAFAAALFVALLPYQALAQEIAGAGAYVETRVGLFWPDDMRGTVFGTTADLTFDTGWAVEVATGYYITDYFRGELGLAWRETQVDDLEIVNVDQPLDESYIGLFTAMLNGYLEVPLVLGGRGVRPFIGGGVGFAYFDVDIETTTGSLTANSGNFTFAFQALAGVAVQLTPSIALTGTYSYLGTTDTESDGLDGLVIKDYRTHTLMAGVRYFF